MGCASAKSGAGDDDDDTDSGVTSSDGALSRDGALPDGGPPLDAAPAIDAAPDSSTPKQVIDDTAAEFAAGTHSATTVEPYGAVAPVAYFTGGLLASASDT